MCLRVARTSSEVDEEEKNQPADEVGVLWVVFTEHNCLCYNISEGYYWIE